MSFTIPLETSPGCSFTSETWSHQLPFQNGKAHLTSSSSIYTAYGQARGPDFYISCGVFSKPPSQKFWWVNVASSHQSADVYHRSVSFFTHFRVRIPAIRHASTGLNARSVHKSQGPRRIRTKQRNYLARCYNPAILGLESMACTRKNSSDRGRPYRPTRKREILS